MEELSEAQHAVSKCLRFGLDDVKDGVMNVDYLTQELTDISAIIDLIEDGGDIIDSMSTEEWDKAVIEKKEKVQKYMKYSKDRGCLDD